MLNPTRDRQAPWPQRTPSPAPAPIPSSSRIRKGRRRSLSGHVDRQIDSRDGGDVIPDEAAVQTCAEAAEEQCQFFSGNNVISCFPNSSTVVPQHQFSSFVWNTRLPTLTQTNLVNIYLLSATEQGPSHNDIILQWNNVGNPQGQAGLQLAQVNDSWWGDRGNEWNGSDLPFLFQWAVTPASQTLDENVTLQPIFTGLRKFLSSTLIPRTCSHQLPETTFADSVVASMSSTSAAAAASSASAASAAAGAGSGNVQDNGGSSFPHWAIAVIVILGFLALLASGILTFFMMRRLRRRRQTNLSHRGSMGSSTPMMRNAEAGEPTSPVIASAFGAAASNQRPGSPEIHDGASTVSRGSDAAFLSGADAAVMANAFRTALRKPNFAGRPEEEGESPESDPLNAGGDPGLINRELAEEGRDIRSVGSSRGVRVETLSDAADDRDTVHDFPR
ncbi:uncharacterized protein PHACADRAFT_166893 [Phanerochaete carnosa HHB-10118-sp]|uniref:Uncharacterized protein n=1 Tax=Phanerochaete carnosa (strain HHB-10118-sp) TaxID=650164 RepID=K5VSI0_PHACS|nr:uncharacterized protein PHACADRAFT_166893 [Phanerochaete carnosa HHB-10118-sp]EKM49524.1 hypothetical protein PHACADRAFT_166893 [Phanerochaete carnosa HHB-10118-sp]